MRKYKNLVQNMKNTKMKNLDKKSLYKIHAENMQEKITQNFLKNTLKHCN